MSGSSGSVRFRACPASHACQAAGSATKITEIDTPAFRSRLEVNRDVSILAISSWLGVCGHRVSHAAIDDRLTHYLV
jgi:hypothetical protein